MPIENHFWAKLHYNTSTSKLKQKIKINTKSLKKCIFFSFKVDRVKKKKKCKLFFALT